MQAQDEGEWRDFARRRSRRTLQRGCRRKDGYQLKRSAPARDRIADDLRHRISTGSIAPGSPLPSEARLGAEFSASRGTVRAVLSTLADLGLIESVPAKGWFVSQLDRTRDVDASVSDVVERLRIELQSGTYQLGDRFYSEREVCERYQLSRHSARNVLLALESAGLIAAVHGRGRFVR
jgi:DNA-binding GntR family transcriptional regulator